MPFTFSKCKGCAKCIENQTILQRLGQFFPYGACVIRLGVLASIRNDSRYKLEHFTRPILEIKGHQNHTFDT